MTLTFKRIKSTPAYQLVSESIEREILAGRIKVGAKLPTEGKLAEQFQVNRSTVREGIRLLEQSGLVRREGGKRLHASLPLQHDLASRVSRALVMHQVNFREVWETAMVLEPATAQSAAIRITSAQLGVLQDNVLRTEKAVRLGESFVGLDIAFHALIAEATGNRVLLLAREPMSLLFYPAMDVLARKLPKAGQRLVQAHKRILDALKSGDDKSAGEWMRKHIVDFKRGYLLADLDMEQPVERLALPPADDES